VAVDDERGQSQRDATFTTIQASPAAEVQDQHAQDVRVAREWYNRRAAEVGQLAMVREEWIARAAGRRGQADPSVRRVYAGELTGPPHAVGGSLRVMSQAAVLILMVKRGGVYEMEWGPDRCLLRRT
jgi:hypothetical protein